MIRVAVGVRGAEAGPLVAAALMRSVSGSAVTTIDDPEIESAHDVLVAVDPDAAWDRAIADWCKPPRRKLIVFGRLPVRLGQMVGARESGALPAQAALCAPALPHRPMTSAAYVEYGALAGRVGQRRLRRPFVRFDFNDEWNNHGYGAIRADGSIWSVAQDVRIDGRFEIARVAHEGGAGPSYAGLFSAGGAEVLWFNRAVGPLDSFEWRMVEVFLSSHAADTHACQPVIEEIPYGHDACVTMRLDCDEDIASAAPLADAYRAAAVPFSLAVCTALLPGERHARFLRRVLSEGGSILAHSRTHPANWGGDHARALAEAGGAADELAAATGRRPVNAVSPFHQSPTYALRALAESGYAGCIGGTIREYPNTVTARGGALAGLSDSFVFHTQQCMLHGDGLAASGDPIAVYREAFDLAFESRSLFGFLDHPFSARYAYGWASEDARISAHKALVVHMRQRARHPLFLSEDDALAFLRGKGAVRVRSEVGGLRLEAPSGPARLQYAASYRGEVHRIPPAGLVLPIAA